MDDVEDMCGVDADLATGHPEPPVGEALFLADLEEAARCALPGAAWDFVEGGSGDELTLAANRAAFDAVGLVPRVLAGAATCTKSRLLGAETDLPMVVAPMAYHRVFHGAGEPAMAEAARQAGIPFVLSTMASASIEEVAAVGARNWFQLYWLRDRSAVLDLVRRAEDARYSALMVTVDVPVMACRRRDRRNSFRIPEDVTAVNLGAGHGAAHRAITGRSAVATDTNALFESMLSWHDVRWLRERTRLPLVLKGILHPQDALRAAEVGVDAVVVSNHGGRQLDGAVPSVTALPAIVDAVGDRMEILLDSGVRSGTDILRALALGADGVLVGRPLLWGLAAAGTAGASRTVALLREGLHEAMQLAGCPDVRSARQLTTMPLIAPAH